MQFSLKQGHLKTGIPASLPRSEGKQKPITFPLERCLLASPPGKPACSQETPALFLYGIVSHRYKHTSITYQGHWIAVSAANSSGLWSIPMICRNKLMHLTQATKKGAGPHRQLRAGGRKGMCSQALLLGCQHAYCREGVWIFPALTSFASFVPRPVPSLLCKNLWSMIKIITSYI